MVPACSVCICECCCQYSEDQTHITEEGLGPGVVAAVGELSQEEEGELGLQFLVVRGPAVFLMISWGLKRRSGRVWSQQTTSSSIFCEKFRSVDVGEREIMCLMSVSLALVFPVAVKCCPGFPGCFPERCPRLLSLGTVVIRHRLHVMSSVGRAQLGCP